MGLCRNWKIIIRHWEEFSVKVVIFEKGTSEGHRSPTFWAAFQTSMSPLPLWTGVGDFTSLQIGAWSLRSVIVCQKPCLQLFCTSQGQLAELPLVPMPAVDIEKLHGKVFLSSVSTSLALSYPFGFGNLLCLGSLSFIQLLSSFLLSPVYSVCFCWSGTGH